MHAYGIHGGGMLPLAAASRLENQCTLDDLASNLLIAANGRGMVSSVRDFRGPDPVANQVRV